MFFRTWVRTVLCLPLIPHEKGRRQKQDRQTRARAYRSKRSKHRPAPNVHVRISTAAGEWSEMTESLLDRAQRTGRAGSSVVRSSGLEVLGKQKVQKGGMKVKRKREKGTEENAREVAKMGKKGKVREGEIGPEVVRWVIDRIGEMFYHIPYTVSDYAALTLYGWDMFDLDHIKITCPPESLASARCWATTMGMTPIPNQPDNFTIRISAGTSHRLHLTAPEQDYNSINFVRTGRYDAAVMTLPCIADGIAREYTASLRSSSDSTQGKQMELSRDISWILHRIIRSTSPRQRLTPDRVPSILDKAFWLPFTLSFPESTELFRRAGLELRDDGYGALEPCSADEGDFANDFASLASSETTLVEGELPARPLRRVTGVLDGDCARLYRTYEDELMM